MAESIVEEIDLELVAGRVPFFSGVAIAHRQHFLLTLNTDHLPVALAGQGYRLGGVGAAVGSRA
jgi:hypothetical protein